MQRHDGLAGAGAPLAYQDALARAADDLVLLGLDGGHDLPQLAVPALFERCVQGPVGVQPRPVAVAVAVAAAVAVERVEVEDLVFEIREYPAAAHEVAASQQAERVAPGGAEERLGDRRPPVHHHGFLMLVGHREPADIERLARAVSIRAAIWAAIRLMSFGTRLRRAVDATEHQRR